MCTDSKVHCQSNSHVYRIADSVSGNDSNSWLRACTGSATIATSIRAYPKLVEQQRRDLLHHCSRAPAAFPTTATHTVNVTAGTLAPLRHRHLFVSAPPVY